jgi:predicted acylesterase/phospholipase RssA
MPLADRDTPPQDGTVVARGASGRALLLMLAATIVLLALIGVGRSPTLVLWGSLSLLVIAWRARAGAILLLLAPTLVLWIVHGFIASYDGRRDLVILAGSAFITWCIGLLRPGARLISWRAWRELGRLRALRLAILFLAVGWIGVSLGDNWFEARPIESASLGRPLPPQADDPSRARITMALSGGGYRAALLHAGALHVLDSLGVIIDAMASVSGGSIIGAFHARNGRPTEFRDAVVAGRFNLTREILTLGNAGRQMAALRLPFLNDRSLVPGAADFTRSDVQAELLDRLFLQRVSHRGSALRGRPELMICTTDLARSAAVGITPRGTVSVFFTPPQERIGTSNPVQSTTEGLRSGITVIADRGRWLPGTTRMSTLVAASGAFPGALRPMRFALGSDTLLLADGGISDNLCYGLARGAQRLARDAARSRDPLLAPGGGTVLEHWNADVLLISDGSALAARSTLPGNELSEVNAAIDAVYASASLSSEPRAADDIPVIVLGPRQLLPDDIRRVRVDDPSGAAIRLPFGPSIAQRRRLGSVVPRLWFSALPRPVLDAIVAGMPAIPRGQAVFARDQLLAQGILSDSGWTVDGTTATEPARALHQLVKHELWRTTRAFLSAGTLRDQYDVATASAIFQLGSYLTLMNLPYLRCAQQSARARTPSTSCTPPARPDWWLEDDW